MANCVQCGRKLPPFSFGKKLCPWCVQHEAAQRGELPENATQPVMPTPWTRTGNTLPIGITQILIGINATIFVFMVVAGNSVMDPSTKVLLRLGANFAPYTLSGEWWRLITYMFLHGGIIHIAFNMWCLWDLGRLSESLYGRWTYLGVYLLCGVGGGVASAWRGANPSVGASGAIFGLAGALIASFYLGEFSLPRFVIQSTLRSLVIFAVVNLGLGAAMPFVDNSAHVGGLVTGLILGALIAKVAPERDAGRRVLVWFAVFALVAGSAFWLQRSRSYFLHAARADRLLDQHKPDEAIAELQALIRQRPDYAPARYELALAYVHQDKLDEAEATLKQLLVISPNYNNARYTLAFLYLQREQYAEAGAMFTQFLKAEPDDPRAHFGLGMALAGQNNFPAAIAEYQKTIQLDEQTSGVYLQLGYAYAAQKKYDEAIAAFQKQQELGQDNRALELALADAYEAKGLKEQAGAVRQKAAQILAK
ncbi:MAG: rhomboid family intramembrane serine protease [Acidobacteria bacterium]|nr:rhomboid family intramembrane serine protease [Acidobacteriota bacterium]